MNRNRKGDKLNHMRSWLCMLQGVSSTHVYRRRRQRPYDVTVEVLAAVSKAGGEVVVVVVVVVVAAVVVGICADKGVLMVGGCVGTGVVPVDAGVGGAGVEDRVWAGEGVGSVVRRQRSLSVSFGALTTCSGGRRSR
jgi:hypothetical protein